MISKKLKIKFTVEIVCICILVFLSLFSSACLFKKLPIVREQLIEEERRQTEYTEEAIKNSSVLKDLDSLCKEIPKPSKFEFIKKVKGNNSVFISHGYYSDYNFDIGKKFYLDYFSERGWEFIGYMPGVNTDMIEFRKEKYQIQIEHGFMGEAMNYTFTCENLS